jgi:uncharacterized ferritin-like protein (DUF455 family)
MARRAAVATALPIDAAGDLHAAARACLEACDPDAKVAAALALARELAAGRLAAQDARRDEAPLRVGRPQRPTLVPPRRVAQRGLGTPAGRAAFVHAIAHIEFNAINLACDAAWRFRGLPADYYADWIGVAADEARHFALLRARLRELGHDYGDFEAHDGLWEMAERTADSCLARMALVPRVLEARGLDVTPGMIERLHAVGDQATAEILALILREEIAHVAAGTRWFHWCCARAGREPRATFAQLLSEHARGALRRPFNHAARGEAGFDAAELQTLEALVEGAR